MANIRRKYGIRSPSPSPEKAPAAVVPRVSRRLAAKGDAEPAWACLMKGVNRRAVGGGTSSDPRVEGAPPAPSGAVYRQCPWPDPFRSRPLVPGANVYDPIFERDKYRYVLQTSGNHFLRLMLQRNDKQGKYPYLYEKRRDASKCEKSERTSAVELLAPRLWATCIAGRMKEEWESAGRATLMMKPLCEDEGWMEDESAEDGFDPQNQGVYFQDRIDDQGNWGYLPEPGARGRRIISKKGRVLVDGLDMVSGSILGRAPS